MDVTEVFVVLTRLALYIKVQGSPSNPMLRFAYEVSLGKAHVLKIWSPVGGAAESWLDQKGTNLATV